MKNIIYNLGYLLKEAKKIIGLNLFSNMVSFLSTGLILFILGMVLTGWGISNQLVEMLKEEAEISAYFDENISIDETTELVNYIKQLDGVEDATLIDKDEAYHKMEAVLGEEAKILELFEENPLEAYVEVRISLDTMDTVLENVENLEGISFVRNNKEVLIRIQGITKGLMLLGYLVIVAVSITTLVIISHMIRLGIYHNRDQINTLRLLGAPDSFIGFPFVLVGLLLTAGGGLLAISLITILIKEGYSQMNGLLPFLPLPSKKELITNMVTLVMSVSVALGIIGSLFGLSSTKKVDHS